MIELKRLREFVHDVREVVEGVVELIYGRRRTVAVTGIIGCDDMITVGKLGHEIAEHLRRGRKAVQQQQRRRIFRSGFTVEDVETVYLRGSMDRAGLGFSCP